MSKRNPPKPVHVAGTNKGEEMVLRNGREPGRCDDRPEGYRTARDSTGINAHSKDVIDPRMVSIPPV